MYDQTLLLPNNRNAPDLFIIGGARCGSTSLHYYLDHHPGIYMCQPDKEPSYYCDIYGVKNPSDYAANFSGAKPGQLLGDASTPYLTCPASAGLIHAANPNARIIAILRQPAERAYSLYLKMCSLGHETAPSFEAALNREEAVVKESPLPRWRGYHYNYLYFHSGLYSKQLRLYFELFPREQLHILLFEDLTACPQTACDSIAAWLGLPPMPSVNPEPRNKAVRPRFLKFQHWLKHELDPMLQKTHFPWRSSLLGHLLEWNTDQRPPPKLNQALRKQLNKRYARDIQDTSLLIGRDLEHWLL